jgi:WD40 repeat protein
VCCWVGVFVVWGDDIRELSLSFPIQTNTQMLQVLEGHSGPVNSVAFSPTVRLWDAGSGEVSVYVCLGFVWLVKGQICEALLEDDDIVLCVCL